MLIDSHCHLQALDSDLRERALDEARGAGVSGFLVPATKPGRKCRSKKHAVRGRRCHKKRR